MPLLPHTAAVPAVSPRRAFTLVELLAVMAVIVILLALIGPVVTALKNAGDVNKAVYDIAGILEQSRAYAMGNNTYVYVGIAETDVSLSSNGTQKPGTGRLCIAVVATRDGTQGFNANSLQQSNYWNSVYPTFVANLNVIGKPLVFDNLHVPDLNSSSNPPPATGNMARPALPSDSTSTTSYSLGSSQCTSATPYDYPVGASVDAGQYSFKKIIQFNPQGVARIQNANNPSAITSYLEIGLQQTRGTVVPTLPASPTTGNIAALQIDGMTGAVRIYRP